MTRDKRENLKASWTCGLRWTMWDAPANLTTLQTVRRIPMPWKWPPSLFCSFIFFLKKTNDRMATRAMTTAMLTSPLFSPRSLTPKLSAQMETAAGAGTSTQETQTPAPQQTKKKIFVAGSSGRTGKKIVQQLLSKGFAVRAGAVDLDKARSNLPTDPGVDIVSRQNVMGSWFFFSTIWFFYRNFEIFLGCRSGRMWRRDRRSWWRRSEMWRRWSVLQDSGILGMSLPHGRWAQLLDSWRQFALCVIVEPHKNNNKIICGAIMITIGWVAEVWNHVGYMRRIASCFRDEISCNANPMQTRF